MQTDICEFDKKETEAFLVIKLRKEWAILSQVTYVCKMATAKDENWPELETRERRLDLALMNQSEKWNDGFIRFEGKYVSNFFMPMKVMQTVFVNGKKTWKIKWWKL